MIQETIMVIIMAWGVNGLDTGGSDIKHILVPKPLVRLPQGHNTKGLSNILDPMTPGPRVPGILGAQFFHVPDRIRGLQGKQQSSVFEHMPALDMVWVGMGDHQGVDVKALVDRLDQFVSKAGIDEDGLTPFEYKPVAKGKPPVHGRLDKIYMVGQGFDMRMSHLNIPS